MPYNYQRKTIPASKDHVELAIQRIINGESENQVCADLKLSRATVQCHRKAKLLNVQLHSPGCLSSLPAELEKEVAWISRIAAVNGFGLSKRELRSFVGVVVKRHLDCHDDLGVYLRKHCQFVSGVPSYDWVTKFMKRNHLSLLNASPVDRCPCSASGDPFIIYRFFGHLQEELHKIWTRANTQEHLECR